LMNDIPITARGVIKLDGVAVIVVCFNRCRPGKYRLVRWFLRKVDT